MAAKKKAKKPARPVTPEETPVTGAMGTAERVVCMALDAMHVLQGNDSDEYTNLLSLQVALSNEWKMFGARQMRELRYERGDDKADRIERTARADSALDTAEEYVRLVSDLPPDDYTGEG